MNVSMRRPRSLLMLSIGLVTLVVLTGPMAASAASTSDAAHACQQGGYLDWTREDGTPFRNTGACVSYVAHGGILVPVEGETEPFLTIVWNEPSFSQFSGLLTGAGLEPGATVWLNVTFLDGSSEIWESRVVDGAGKLNAPYGFQPCATYRTFVFETRDLDGDLVQATAPLPC